MFIIFFPFKPEIMALTCIFPRRDFAQKAKSRGRAHARSSRIYLGKYLQLKYTVSMPEKISICLIRGRNESLGNDDVSIVHSRKYMYEVVRMTSNRKYPKGPLRLIL